MSTAPLAHHAESQFWQGVETTSKFFMGDADVQRALHQIVDLLDQLNVPYAVIGAMALNEFGYQRATTDVGLLLNAEGLSRLKAAALGRGYLEKFPGSRGMRDTAHASRSTSFWPAALLATDA